jgi:hypothetical protein
VAVCGVPTSDPLAQVLPVYRVTVDPAFAVPFNVTEAWLVMLSVLLDPVSSPAIRSGMLTIRGTVSMVKLKLVDMVVFPAASVAVAVMA